MPTANANNALRWLWYVLIGVGLSILAVLWGLSSPGKYDHKYDKWAQLVMLTAILFGYILKWGWHYRRRSRFWELYSILFLGHCAVFVILFSHGRWPNLLLGVAGYLEFVAVASLIALVMGEKGMNGE